MNIAIYAITKHGAKHARRLKQELPYSQLFVAEVGRQEGDQSQLLSFPLSTFVEQQFAHFDAHIFICATGIVSRVISPLIVDKRTDPAVVTLDEQANFAISLLSGHRGGANALTERVAHIVKATAVITTASDVSESVSVDMLGAPFGWQLDSKTEQHITGVSAAVINDQPVVIVQQAGERKWWKYDKRMPAHIVCHNTVEGINPSDFQGAIVISDQLDVSIPNWQKEWVLWRPKSLVLGIGCDRNTPASVIKEGLAQFSQQFNLSLDSVAALSSIDLKSDEQGIITVAEQNQWSFDTFAPAVLDSAEGIENPSEYVKKVTGSQSVAEAAALTLSKTNSLVVAKWVFKQDGYNMTLACCRREFSESLVQQNRKNWLNKKRHHGHGAKPEPIKLNAYGNEVVEGYQCKPKHVDLNRPMLYHSHHILLCEGGRCAKAGSKNLAHELRTLLKEMGLGAGNKRIKISRTMCAGACRNRATMVIYQRHEQGQAAINDGLWLKNIEEISEDKWRVVFNALADNTPLHQRLGDEHFAVIAPAEELQTTAQIEETSSDNSSLEERSAQQESANG
ncbi:cobalamin biosynthesis protein [Vibrio sp. 99-8-1]|uniref:cobalamin biosynthesis protein n=1 Tax=Vibrio sp. 99-8-1 TaxID=2607602 RepID=UPI001493C022|nr:cobalamin biosynthesis protein [Vibrio sp. 99-8-1]NOI65227.1 cobalamin biosynthesis protein [Vibrio sp. 99-8-1]